MQTITVHPEPSEVMLGMSAFGPTLFTADKGADHPTPPAPDRGGKTKPKPAKTGKKK